MKTLIWNNNKFMQHIKRNEECDRVLVDVGCIRIEYGHKRVREYKCKNLILIDVNGKFSKKPNALLSRETFNGHRGRVDVLNMKYLTPDVLRVEVI